MMVFVLSFCIRFLVLWSTAGEKLIHHFLLVAQLFQFVQFIDLFRVQFWSGVYGTIIKNILLRRFFILGFKHKFTQDIKNIIINIIIF